MEYQTLAQMSRVPTILKNIRTNQDKAVPITDTPKNPTKHSTPPPSPQNHCNVYKIQNALQLPTQLVSSHSTSQMYTVHHQEGQRE